MRAEMAAREQAEEEAAHEEWKTMLATDYSLPVLDSRKPPPIKGPHHATIAPSHPLRFKLISHAEGHSTPFPMANVGRHTTSHVVVSG